MIHESIQRMERSIKKKLVKHKLNSTTIGGRLDLFNQIWHRCVALDLEVKVLVSPKDRESVD